MRVVVGAAVVGAGFCFTASLLQAQRTTRGSRAQPTQANASVRAELATVLLQSGRYDEAAREFRRLLARDPNSFEYRLGLAHALAWGDHPKEAEPEIVQLLAKRPSTPGLDSLLRVVRDAYDPRAVEAAQWVASDPWYAPYRLALARALAREGMQRLAIAHYDTLLSRPAPGRIPDRGALLREMADAYVGAGDRLGGADRMRAALALSPADTALRHTVASMLADARHDAEARAQYDTLLLQAPTGPLLLERARLRLALGDRAGGESDLWASQKLQPSADAFLLLGDLLRERGDYRGARSMYAAARQSATGEVRTAVAGALAQLDREERPAILAPLVGDDPGWRVSEAAAADNLGLAYSVLSLGRTVPIASSTRITLGAEWRELSQHTSARSVDASGFGGTVGAWQEAAYGPVLGRLEIEGGAVQHPAAGTLGQGRAALSAWLFAWQATGELATQPAYPSLFSVDALLPAAGGPPLTERDAAVTLGGPLGQLDVGVRWERAQVSDGNRRLTIESYARYPLGANVFAVYSGSGVAFAERSILYWDPEQYSSQGAGVEYAVRQARGLSFAARVLPSYAWSNESPIIASPDGSIARGPIARHSAVQMGASTEAGYRVHGWEAQGALNYGRGRAGDYQRFGASITVRVGP
jgi:tetratricopeptide (TPR) repeat protein